MSNVMLLRLNADAVGMPNARNLRRRAGQPGCIDADASKKCSQCRRRIVAGVDRYHDDTKLLRRNPRLVARLAQESERLWADVFAMRESEVERDRFTARLRKRKRLAALIGQREIRRGLRRREL